MLSKVYRARAFALAARYASMAAREMVRDAVGATIRHGGRSRRR